MNGWNIGIRWEETKQRQAMTQENPVIIYGLPNCDSCRKALRHFADMGRAAMLRDIRKDPLTADERARFITAFGEKIINRASTTWRGLDEAARALPMDVLLAAHPAVMKRPVIESDAGLTLGLPK